MKNTLILLDVVGESHYKENIVAAGYENEDYKLSKSQLLKEYDVGDEISKYEFGGISVSVLREPDNAFDAKAIRVCFDGKTVGHIARKDQIRVEPYLDRENVFWDAEVTYGPFKEIVEDDDGKVKIETHSFDFSITVFAYEYIDDPEPTTAPTPVSSQSSPKSVYSYSLPAESRHSPAAYVWAWIFVVLSCAALLVEWVAVVASLVPSAEALQAALPGKAVYLSMCAAVVFGVLANVSANRAE